MPYRNEVQPLNLFGDYVAGRQAGLEQQRAQQVNALGGLQVQRQQAINALGQNPNATPEQYVRAGDVQTGAALDTLNQRGQVDKQQAVQQLAGIAQKALTITDPAQRKSFLQQAGQIYGPAFQALGADMSQFPQMLAMPDDALAQKLQQVAQFAAPQKPIEVPAGGSIVVPNAQGTAFTPAFTAPNAGQEETARHNREMERLGGINAGREHIPSGYEPDPTKPGQLRPIAGGPQDPSTGKGKITDAERLSAAYASRMRESADRITELGYVPTTADMVKFNLLLSGPGVRQSMANKTLSPEAQKYIQSVQDFNRAKLRKESGAAIGKEEVFGDLATFFPVPGDTSDTLAQKAAARETAINGMINASGAAYKAPEKASSFATEAEAETAAKAGKLKSGTRITIGGVPGTWQ
jgi:hypothetical protein